jgi:hypothetical protein
MPGCLAVHTQRRRGGIREGDLVPSFAPVDINPYRHYERPLVMLGFGLLSVHLGEHRVRQYASERHLDLVH